MGKRKQKLSDESSCDESVTAPALQPSLAPASLPAPTAVKPAKPKRAKSKTNKQLTRSSRRIAQQKEDTNSTLVKIPKANKRVIQRTKLKLYNTEITCIFV